MFLMFSSVIRAGLKRTLKVMEKSLFGKVIEMRYFGFFYGKVLDFQKKIKENFKITLNGSVGT